MAFMQSMALGVRLSVNSTRATSGMRQLGAVTDQVRGGMQKLGARMEKVQAAIQGVQMVSAAVNLALGAAAFKAANFEQQMSGVQAVTLGTAESPQMVWIWARRLRLYQQT